MTASTGCSIFSNAAVAVRRHECIDEFMMTHRQRVMAARAWHRHKACMKNHCHLDDVKRGFMDAYQEVAEGGSGCVPAVAPRSYWGWRYQSADGNGAVNAWYEGYPLGVKAAEQDGVGHYNDIQTANFQTRTSATPNPAIGSEPMPALGQVPAPIERVRVPGGYLDPNGNLYDDQGNLIGKGTIEDKAVETGAANMEAAAPPPPVEDSAAFDAETFPAPTSVASESAVDATESLQPESEYSANFSDQSDALVTSTEYKPSSYQLDDPSKEEIDAVIDDIFGKPQTSSSG
ncbi:MAG: hypothetical protein AAF989_13750, partial [Planctomycetota bacterium]